MSGTTKQTEIAIPMYGAMLAKEDLVASIEDLVESMLDSDFKFPNHIMLKAGIVKEKARAF